MDINSITDKIIGAAIKVHRVLGPGLLESSYQTCLEIELKKAHLEFLRQAPLGITYEGTRIECLYRLDFLIERCVVVEIRSVARLEPIHTAQMLTYLRHARCPVGLLINFNVRMLPDGITRLVHNYKGTVPRVPRVPR